MQLRAEHVARVSEALGVIPSTVNKDHRISGDGREPREVRPLFRPPSALRTFINLEGIMPPKGKVAKAKAWALQRKGVISDSLCRRDACRLTLRVKGT